MRWINIKKLVLLMICFILIIPVAAGEIDYDAYDYQMDQEIEWEESLTGVIYHDFWNDISKIRETVDNYYEHEMSYTYI